MINFFKQFFVYFNKKKSAEAHSESASYQICCNKNIIICYRGLSDNKQYISYDRSFNDLKYFRNSCLKVFCSECRQRIYFEE